MRAVDDARAALGARLRELRRAAHLSGVDLAARCGWHSSKISRIERGKQAPSEADLADWCASCDSMAVLDDLVASLRNLRAIYLEWQRTLAARHAHRQRQSIKVEGETRLIRWYDPDTMPGLLQTERATPARSCACAYP